jgi:hypothetical protein
LITAGGFTLVGNAVRVEGYEPAYGPVPRLGEHGDLVGLDDRTTSDDSAGSDDKAARDE